MRPNSPELDALIESGHKFPVLDDGFIRVVDYMGNDASIVQAARVSYGAGTKKVSEDTALIRYLLRHHHSTPFEMASLKLHIRVPMDCWRQWIRHRTFCLAEGTEVYFDLPGGISRRGNQLYKLKIEDIWDRFQPTVNTQRPDKQRNPYHRRDRVQSMHLRQMNEDTGAIQHTRVVDVFQNGVKPIFRVTLADGKTIESTNDHQFMFVDGWSTLGKQMNLEEVGGKAVWDSGDYYMHVNGVTVEVPALYQDKDWLDEQYNVLERKIADIAEDCGVSYHTIRKWLSKHNIQHEKGGRSKEPWNKGKTYTLGSRELSEAWIEANQRSRAGEASNFWKGGVSTERESIGRWTTQKAAKIHRKNGWTCQLCHQRANELHTHHIVPVWADESLARDEYNLTTLCGDCHRSIAGNELDYVERLGGPPVKTEWIKRPRVGWNNLTKTRLVRVEKVEFVGEKMTYDIEVEGPYHNFIANGIVTHNSVNEYSTRYSEAIDSRQTTPPDQWRSQSKSNKQGSGNFLDPEVGKVLTEAEKSSHTFSDTIYQERLAKGVAREQARKDLPLSTYTEAYWSGNLHNLLHFLRLRMDSHAQKEIRDYACVIGNEIVSKWCPAAWDAFKDYRMDTIQLTAIDQRVFRSEDPIGEAIELGWLDENGKPKRSRERLEFEAKMEALGNPINWLE